MAQHVVVIARDDHRRRVEGIGHDLWKLKSPVEIDTWLHKEVTNLDDARKVLAIIISTIGHLVAQEQKRL